MIRYAFLITSSWYFWSDLNWDLEYWEVATVDLDRRGALRFASRELLNEKESELLLIHFNFRFISGHQD